MNFYNRAYCIENIFVLAKEKNIKIGELENAAGVSSGYLSRLKKEGNESNPSIDILCAIADKLDVSIDSLVSKRLSVLSPEERYMLEFLNKMIKNTEDEKIWWKNYNENEIKDVPLFNYLKAEEDDSFHYLSLFTKRFETINGEVYSLNTRTSGTFYLIQIDPRNGFRRYDFEMMVLTKENEVKKVCGSFEGSSDILRDKLDSLYHLIYKKVREPKVDKDVKDMLDAFLKDISQI